jgi:hypothetical protein
MAEIGQLEIALRNADAAGDTQAAQTLAAEIMKMRTPAAGPDVAEDVLKSGGVGVAKGAIGLAGLGGDVRQLWSAGTSKVGELLGASPETVETVKGAAQKIGQNIPVLNAIASGPTSDDIKKKVEGYTGEFYKPQTKAGEYAQTVGEFAPGIIGGPAGLGRRALTQVLAPGLASESAGQLTKGSAAEPYARIAGAIAGGVAPSALARLATPLPANQARTAAVDALRHEGVTDITAGQATGRKGLQYFEAERGNGSQLAENAAEQFTAATLRRAGINSRRATPEVIDDAFNRLGTEFDYLAQNNRARVDSALVSDLRNAVNDYNGVVSPPNRTPAVRNYLEEINNIAQRAAGDLPGEAYQSLRSRMERTARGMGNNPEARNAIRDMRHALDDAMERSIRRNGRPDDLQAWQDARRQYRNMIVIEQAATGAGEGAASGLISPAKLRQATVSKQGRRNYARGDGDFAELARSGEQVMTPLPNSGTPGRLAAQNMGMGASAVVGALLGGGAGTAVLPGIGSSVGGAAGAAAGLALPRVAGALATSRTGRRYLGNQMFAGAQQRLNPRQAAIVDALLAQHQAQGQLPARN